MKVKHLFRHLIHNRGDKSISNVIEIENEILGPISIYKEKILLNLSRLRTMPWEEIRPIIPWRLIIFRLGFLKILKLIVSDILKKLGYSKKSYELSEQSLNQIYQLTYLYYLQPVFKEINDSIGHIFKSHESKYHYVYLYKDTEINTGDTIINEKYKSKESEFWGKLDKRMAWLSPFISTISIFGIVQLTWPNLKFDLSNIWFKIIVVASFPVVYRMIRILIKFFKGNSKVKDEIVGKIYEKIQQNLDVKEVTESIVYIYTELVKQQAELAIGGGTGSKKRIIIPIIGAILVIYATFFIYSPQKDGTRSIPTQKYSEASPQTHSEPTVEEIRQLFDTQKNLISLVEVNLPSAEIVFSNDIGITGKVGAAKIKFTLDSETIKVGNINDNGNVQLEVSIQSIIKVSDWTIINKKFYDYNGDKTLKEKLGVNLNDTFLRLYQSNSNVMSKYDIEKRNAETEAKSYVENIVKKKYPNLIVKTSINFQTTDLDLSNTSLK